MICGFWEMVGMGASVNKGNAIQGNVALPMRYAKGERRATVLHGFSL
jgi:hypothetical protein